MKSRFFKSWSGAAALGLATLLAAACGGNKDGSLLDAGTSGNGSGAKNGGGGSGGVVLDPSVTGGETGVPPEGGANCGFTNLTATPPDVNVLLVVDKSGSMKDTPDGFDSDKWTALRSALEAAFDETKAKISFGLELYPYSGKSGQALSDSCQMPAGDAVVVPVQGGAKAAPLILGALDDNPPEGGTPTAAALSRAYAYFKSGAGKALKGEKYVLLATDGGPNCSADESISCGAASCTVNMDGLCPGKLNCCDAKLDPEGPSKCLDDAASVQAVADLADAGIKTFVIGIPGTEAYADTLDALAAQSGVENPDAPPAYFAVSAKGGVDGLTSVFQRITTGLITSCRLQLEGEPPNINDVFVVIDGVLIKKGEADGWRESAPPTSPPTLEIQGATCDKLEAEGAEYINVSYGCPNFEPR